MYFLYIIYFHSIIYFIMWFLSAVVPLYDGLIIAQVAAQSIAQGRVEEDD